MVRVSERERIAVLSRAIGALEAHALIDRSEALARLAEELLQLRSELWPHLFGTDTAEAAARLADAEAMAQ